MRLKEKINIKELIMQIGGTILGAFIMALGVSLFLLPNQLSTGGVSGLATITYYLFHIPMGTVIILVNIPLFLVAIFKVGKTFFIKSIIGTISLSLFIDILDRLEPLTKDRFLACVYGGIIIGLGTAVLLKSKTSTGGSDLVSFIARAYKPAIKTSNIIIIVDTIIVTLNMLVFKQVEIGLYSAIAIYLMGKVIDVFFEGIDFTKLLIIVSDKNEEIAKEIERKVQRGITGLYGKGMYTNKEKLILMCAVARGDVSRVKMIAKKVDPRSFMIITDSREVMGEGFKALSE